MFQVVSNSGKMITIGRFPTASVAQVSGGLTKEFFERGFHTCESCFMVMSSASYEAGVCDCGN
jgi:hypothetical protein